MTFDDRQTLSGTSTAFPTKDDRRRITQDGSSRLSDPAAITPRTDRGHARELAISTIRH
jgi:hypothetical protein